MTEALNHYLDQRDEDYERQGEMMKLSDEMRSYETEELDRWAVKVTKLEAELADWHDRRDEKFQMYEDCKAENKALREYIPEHVLREWEYYRDAQLKEKQE